MHGILRCHLKAVLQACHLSSFAALRGASSHSRCLADRSSPGDSFEPREPKLPMMGMTSYRIQVVGFGWLDLGSEPRRTRIIYIRRCHQTSPKGTEIRGSSVVSP